MPEEHSDYIEFGEVARKRLGQQCQYASRYLTGVWPDYPNLSEGLRFLNLDSGNYHDIRIHRDDVEELVRRVQEYRSR